MPFLFPATVFNRAKEVAHKALTLCDKGYSEGAFTSVRCFSIDTDIENPCSDKRYQEALATYTFHIRKHYGAGLVLSFIPGTEAYQARQMFSEKAEEAVSLVTTLLQDKLVNHPCTKLAWSVWLEGMFVSFLKLGPLWQLLSELELAPYGAKFSSDTEKEALEKVCFSAPFFADIYYVKDFVVSGTSQKSTRVYIRKDALKNFIHTLLNPIRVLSDLLNFLERLVYYKTDFPRCIIHKLFNIIRLPMTLVKGIADIPYLCLKSFIWEPYAFMKLAIRQTCVQRESQQGGFGEELGASPPKLGAFSLKIEEEPVIDSGCHIESIWDIFYRPECRPPNLRQ